MQYPHWLMVAGALLVVIGLIGFAFHKSSAEPDDGSSPEPETEDAEQGETRGTWPRGQAEDGGRA
jgi:hypothetical protein